MRVADVATAGRARRLWARRSRSSTCGVGGIWHDLVPGTVEYGAYAHCEGAYAITGMGSPWIYVMEIADTLVGRCTGEPTQPVLAARLTITPAFGPWPSGTKPLVGPAP